GRRQRPGGRGPGGGVGGEQAGQGGRGGRDAQGPARLTHGGASPGSPESGGSGAAGLTISPVRGVVQRRLRLGTSRPVVPGAPVLPGGPPTGGSAHPPESPPAPRPRGTIPAGRPAAIQ